MFQEYLRENQPIAYQTLKNALGSGRMSHAYLFSGPKGTGKKETAYLIAQSLICEHRDVFACEECETCQRIANNTYADMIYINGNERTIRVDDIEDILTRFQKTGLEAYNRKIYILDGIDHATDAAQNKLLKFIEEPAGDSVTAILISERKEQILPTILSRCQIIEFLPLKRESCYEICLSEGDEPLDAYLLSYLYNDMAEIRENRDSDNYGNVRELFCSFLLDLKKSKNLALVNLENDPVIKKNKDKEVLRNFVSLLALFFSDLIRQEQTQIPWYDEQLAFFANSNYNNPDIIQNLLEAMTRLQSESRDNMMLVLEQLVYRL